MAITIDGKVYRNLQEQVKKNQDDIKTLNEKPAPTEFDTITVNNIVLKGYITSASANTELMIDNILNKEGSDAIKLNETTGITIYDIPVSNPAFTISNGTIGINTYTDVNYELYVNIFDDITMDYGASSITATGYSITCSEVITDSEVTGHLTIKKYDANNKYGIYTYDKDNAEYLAAYFTADNNDKTLWLNADLELNLNKSLNFQQIQNESGQTIHSDVYLKQYKFVGTSDGPFALVLVESDGDVFYYGFTNWMDEENVDILVTDVTNKNQYYLTLNAGILTLKSLDKIYYRHNVTIDITNAGTFTFTTVHSQNTPIDSIQDLTAMLGNTLVAGFGLVGGTDITTATIANSLVVGTTIAECYFNTLSKAKVGFATVGAYTIKDNVTAINANAQ